MTNTPRWLDREFLRWIAVLPGAVAAAFLAQIPFRWIVLASRYDPTDRDENGRPIGTLLAIIPAEVLVQLAVAFFNPFMVILAGRTSPQDTDLERQSSGCVARRRLLLRRYIRGR